jgi:hypothetical protein
MDDFDAKSHLRGLRREADNKRLAQNDAVEAAALVALLIIKREVRLSDSAVCGCDHCAAADRFQKLD